MAISVKDVAKVAQVSYSTESRALSDRPRVTSETKARWTRARVQRVAAEMGYLPSAVGRSLMIPHTHTLVVLPGAVRTFHCPLLLQRWQRARRSVHGAGLRIPQDLSVVRCSDIDLEPFLESRLTTIARPKREMGEAAVRMLLDSPA